MHVQWLLRGRCLHLLPAQPYLANCFCSCIVPSYGFISGVAGKDASDKVDISMSALLFLRSASNVSYRAAVRMATIDQVNSCSTLLRAAWPISMHRCGWLNSSFRATASACGSLGGTSSPV